MQPNVTSEASASTKLKVWWLSQPLMFRTLSYVLIGIYLLGVFIFPLPVSQLCNWPAAGIIRFYTWITSAFLHNNLTHIIMNMMTFYVLGPNYERKVGSLGLLVHSLLFAFYGGALVFIISRITDLMIIYQSLAKFVGALSGSNSCGIGFSGVLFSLIGIRAYETGAPTSESVYGMFQAPTRMVPWISLVIIQVMVPNASFLGHLAGLLVGIACAHKNYHNSKIHMRRLIIDHPVADTTKWASFLFPHGSTICWLESLPLFSLLKDRYSVISD